MAGWKDKYGKAAKSGDGLFVKLEDGDAVDFIVHPAGEPHEQVSYFDEAEGKSVKCDRSHPSAQVKILVAAYIVNKRAKGAKAADVVGDTKIIRFGTGAFRDLCDAMDEADIGGTEQVYRLKREGSGLKTKYKVNRITAATPEQIRSASGTDLPDLGKYGDPIEADEEGDTTPAPTVAKGKPATRVAEPLPVMDDSDIPFDGAHA